MPLASAGTDRASADGPIWELSEGTFLPMSALAPRHNMWMSSIEAQTEQISWTGSHSACRHHAHRGADLAAVGPRCPQK